MSLKRLVSLLLITGVLVIIAAIVYLIVVPQPLAIDAEHNNATVHFSADRSRVFLSGGCTTVHWQADQIDRIYYNDQPAIGVGTEQACVQVDRPTLTVYFQDGTSQTYTLDITILLHDLRFWLLIVLALAMLVAAGTLADVPGLSRTIRYSRRVFRPHLPDATLPDNQRRLGRWMGYALSGLSLIFAIAALSTLSYEGMWPGVALVALAAGFTVLGLIGAVQYWMARLMQSRFMVFSPIVWFVAAFVLHEHALSAIRRPDLWSAYQVWNATIFFWLGVFWFAAYALRNFEFGRARRFAWITITATALLIGFMSIVVPFTQEPTISYNTVLADQPVQLMNYVLALSGDAYDYALFTQAFPFVWQHFGGIVHRPTFFMVTSQVCQVADIPVAGYVTGDFGCSSLSLAIISTWITNIAITIVNALIIYEIVRAVSGKPRIGWLAAMLITLSAYTLWYIPNASTDYAETLISGVSLWMLYRLFTGEHHSKSRLAAYGIMFGVLLLVKLNPTYLMFGMLIVLVTRRWSFIWTLVVLPLLVFLFYKEFIPLLGIPYQLYEIVGQWRTLNWLWKEFIYYTPYEMARSMATWVGHTADKTAMFFGFLLIVGIVVMTIDERFPRYMMLMAWAMFLSTTVFAFVLQFSYVSHVLGLIPFIYGAVALGVDRVQSLIYERYGEQHPRLAQALALGVLALPILHNLLQWVAWSNPLAINFGG